MFNRKATLVQTNMLIFAYFLDNDVWNVWSVVPCQGPIALNFEAYICNEDECDVSKCIKSAFP